MTDWQRYTVNVEAAILRDGAYLVIRRSDQEDHAPGTIALPGGKVEVTGAAEHVLEETLRREVLEEVGVTIGDKLEFLESKAFIADNGLLVIDIVFLCRYGSGTATNVAPEEIAAMMWKTASEIVSDPATPPWTRQSIELAEAKRRLVGW